MRNLKKMLAVFLAIIMLVTVIPTNSLSVQAASKSTTVSTQSKLKKALKSSKYTTINVKTKKKVTFTTSAKKYTKKTLGVNGGSITFKNSAQFKAINITNVKSFVEKGSSNTLNVNDSKATIEVYKSAKKTKLNFNKAKANITLKVNGSPSSINLKKATTLSVSGTPKSTLNITNSASGSKITVNAKAKASITLKSNATVTLGDKITSATITLNPKVKATIKNNSNKTITVKASGGGSVKIPKKTTKTITNDGTIGKEDAAKPSYTITFDTNGGTEIPNQVVEEGKSILMPEDPTFDGFTFVGWYIDESLKFKFEPTNAITQNTTLYAKWRVATSSENLHTVTFVTNFGRGEAFQMQTVRDGHPASRPAGTPVRSGFAFKGWFEDAASTINFDFNTPIYGDMTIYAGWGNPNGSDNLYDAETGNEPAEESDLQTICSISDLKIVNSRVKAKINTDRSAIFVASFYDPTGYFGGDTINWSMDSAQNYGNVATLTPSYCESAPIYMEIDNSISLPEHYILVGALYDADTLDPLTEKVICADYTAEGEKFDALTVDDFAGKKVVNFDNDPQENFGVLTTGVKEIQCGASANTLSVSTVEIADANGDLIPNNTFTISNPNTSVNNLVVGDKIAIYKNNQLAYLAKIASITKSNGKVIIKETNDVSLEDFYSTLKIDMSEAAEPEPDISTMAEVIDLDTSLKATIAFNINANLTDHLKLIGEFSGNSKLSITVKYDAKLFRKDYVEVSVITNNDFTFKLSFEGSLESEKNISKEFDGTKVYYPTPITGLYASVAVSVPLEGKLKGDVSFTIKSTTESGFKYNSDFGRQDITKKSYSVDFDGGAEFEVSVGPKLEVGLVFIGETIKAKVTAQVGGKINARLQIGQDDDFSNVDSKHACYTCLSGQARVFFEVKASLSYCIVKNVLDDDVFELTIVSLEGWLNPNGRRPGEFFISILNSSDSIYGGHKKFGWGSCENEKYRTNVETYDANGNKLTGTKVTITKSDGSVAKSAKTDLKTYLYNGVYTASATINNHPVSSSFVINGSPKLIKLTENSTSTTQINGKVCDANTGAAISGAQISIQKGNIVVSTVTSGNDGSFTASVPADTYKIDITKDGYNTYTTNETVVDGQTKYMETVKLTPGDNTGKGGFSGYIKDALSGNVLSNVSLEVRAGANASVDGNILLTLTTDSNGYFEFNPRTFFGINRGLNAGQYTITAKKTGYITDSFNIVIRDNEIVSNQNGSLSPVLDQDEFRIVLRWGSSPSDLDSHYQAFDTSDHVYFSRKSGTTAKLDVDDTSSYGPETITVTNFAATGGFVYSVHNYTNRSSTSSTSLAASDATVTIYHGNYEPVVFHVPVGHDGTVWNVFKTDQNGNIIALNTFEYISSASNVGSGITN